MKREEILLADSIKRTLDEAYTAEIKLYEVMERQTLESVDDPENYEPGDAKSELQFLIDKVYRDTAILAERLYLPQYAALVNGERVAAGPKLTDSIDTPHDILPYFPHLARARAHYMSLRTMTDLASRTVHDVLETILKNTGKIIARKNIKPNSEASVRNAMLEYIQSAFEDARKEVSIPKGFKTYRADIGIPSLRAAIEYKYIKEKNEMKNCLDGIYADMKGYGQDDDWRTFYAVFYMTEPFYRQDEVEREFALVHADLNWTPILVFGQRSS